MSYLLPHLNSAWNVDQAILHEKDRVVCIRFGHEWENDCLVMDEVLSRIEEKVRNFAIIYCVNITDVPDFNEMYELYEDMTLMFFYRNRHMLIDCGTGNNNKITWPIEDDQEMIDILEVVYTGAVKGKGLVVAPRDYSTKLKF